MPLPSLQSLASTDEALADIETLIRRLLATRREGRHLEWKQHPPTGPTVSLRSKYRTVRAVLSFANWEGGFVLFGVAPNGDWCGLDANELAAVDPAHVTELINGCIFPEVPRLNYTDFRHQERLFAVIHVPPSSTAPHITTKRIVEKDQSGKLHVVLEKHALYCRQGAKSDIATPSQHQRIVARRTEQLRDELVRRVSEVQVPVLTSGAQGRQGGAGGLLTVARLTTDPTAPVVRLTRQEGAAGILLHEELSDGIFDEINNVVDSNSLLAKGRDVFVLGEPVYYRIYAERQHVMPDLSRLRLLARTGLHHFYAPNLFWLLRLSPAAIAALMESAASDMRNPQTRGLIRLAVLLGRAASDWLWRRVQRRWGSHPQPPDFFWAFKQTRQRRINDLRLAALRTTSTKLVDLPDADPVPVGVFLTTPSEAAGVLSRCCVAVFDGRKEFRQSARQLDVLAYGREIEELGARVSSELGDG